MEIRHLRCFVVVAEYMSFTKAAHELCLTQPAVSRQIAVLEEELGFRLFDRAPNSVRLTPKGEHFHIGLKGLLEAYEGLVHSSRNLDADKSYRLDVGFLGAVEKRLLPRIAKRLRSCRPDLDLCISRFDMVPLTLGLERGELDVAFTLALALPAGPGIQSRLLCRERLVAVMSADNPLADRKGLDYKDLRGQTFLNIDHPLNAPAHSLLVDYCAQAGFKPKVGGRFHDLDSLFMAVESGVGIGIFPKYRGDEHLSPRLTYVPITGQNCTADCVVAWKQENPNPVLQVFLQAMGIRP